MKVECVKNKIGNLVAKTERVAGKNANLPVLSCLYLTADGNTLQVSSTNLDLGVIVSLPARVFTKGSVVVPASVLSGFLSQLPDEGNVIFEVVNENLTVSTKHTETTIKSLNPNDFPSIPQQTKGQSVTILSQDLVRGLQAVSYSSSTSSMKPELASVYVYGDHKDIVFAATDSFRLAEKRTQMKKLVEFPPTLIPSKNTTDLIRLFEDERKDLEVVISKNQISFSCPSLYVVSRVIDGTFPDYQQVIPREFKTEAILLKQDFITALRISNIFSGSFHRATIKVSPSKKSFEMIAESGQVGKNATKVEAVVKGEELANNFNHRYIADCLQSISSDSVTLGFNGAQKPLVVRGVGDHSFTYLVMPMNR